jgi:muconolactone delta-isomerase
MENQEKEKSFFIKHLETITTLFIIFGVIIFCVVYQPKKVQPILDFLGLKKIDADTPVDIDKAIVQFIKEANTKILKGSHIMIRKTDLKIPNDAIKDYIYWKIKQNFTERNDIVVYSNDSIVVQDIKDNEEIFTINARLEEFNGVYSVKTIDKLLGDDNNYDYYLYKFFISMDKKGRNAITDVSILMRDYAIMDERLELSEFSQKLQTETSLKKMEKIIENVANDSLIEQECIAELEQSLLSFLNYDYKGEHSKQIKILFDDKNCVSEMCYENGKCEPCIDGECPNDCKSKSKCFSYNHHNFDACGSTDIKNNFSIKGCPVGSVWKYNFCEPSGEEPHYSVPENPACINITPKRVKDNTTRK